MRKYFLVLLVAIFLGGCAAARPPILFPEFSGQGFRSEAECLNVCSEYERRDVIGNTVYGTAAGASVGATVALLSGFRNPWATALIGGGIGAGMGALTAPSQHCFEKCRSFGTCETKGAGYNSAHWAEIERLRQEEFFRRQEAERQRGVNDARQDFREENLQE